MDVSVELVDSKIVIQFIPEEGDGFYNEKITMDQYHMFVEAEGISSLSDIHPDHIALSILLVSNPFIKEVLNIPFKVSEGFKQATRVITKYRVKFHEGSHEPYSPSAHSRPGLSFSGGADSTAALLLMPKNTLSVFLDRPLKLKASLYNKSAAYATINYARSIGHEVKSVNCNLEYLRTPVGFPSDLAPAVPLILLSSFNNVDSIAFGTVLESAYRVGHEHCRDYKTSGHYKVWGGLFSAANLPLYLPVSGISEVGTSMIVLNSTFKDYTRSCIRGEFPKSCENCWKCFRKNMVENRIDNQDIGDIDMARWLGVSEVKRKLNSWPISHENVLAWSLQGRNSSGNLRDLLMDRTEGSVRNMDFLMRWYPISIELIPEKYQEPTKRSILSLMNQMTDEEKMQITTHSMSEWLNSERAKEAKNKFDEWILDK